MGEAGRLNEIEASLLVETAFPLLPKKVSGICETGLEPSTYKACPAGTSKLHEEVVQMSMAPTPAVWYLLSLSNLYSQLHGEFSMTS